MEKEKKKLGLKVVPDYLKKLQEIKENITKEEKIESGESLYKKESVQNASIWLYDVFPNAFFKRNQKPLKINILQDIFAYLEDLPKSETSLSKASIRKAMKTYTHNRFYLKACIEGAERIDLQGIVTSHVLESEAQYAKELFDKYLSVFKAKQKKLKPKKRYNAAKT